jgi:hypothetical protein
MLLTGRAASGVARATAWLKGFLERRPRPAAEVLKEGAAAGHTRGALYAAKGRLGVESVKAADRFDGQWAWRMPETKSRLIVRGFARIAKEECPMTDGQCPMPDPTVASGQWSVASQDEREQRRFEHAEDPRGLMHDDQCPISDDTVRRRFEHAEEQWPGQTGDGGLGAQESEDAKMALGAPM